jgi:Spy/CpxP family protein refolding chaperone
MKKIVIWIGVGAFVLGLTLMVGAPVSTRAAASTAAPASAAAPAPAPAPHPEINRALDALRNARAHIKDARHDFGGHRVEALEKVDAAIHQLEICQQYDK